MSNTSNKVKNIIKTVFNLSVDEISDDASPDTVDAWDSLSHMNLITALEEEFNIEFEPDEILDMMNYKLILNVLSSKLGMLSEY